MSTPTRRKCQLKVIIRGVENMTNSFGLSDKISDAESKCLSCGAPLPAEREGQQKFTGGHTSIQILGTDNEDTEKMFINAKQAVKQIDRNNEVRCIRDEQLIASYNIRKHPALVINGSIVSQGIVSDVDSIVDDIEFLGM